MSSKEVEKLKTEQKEYIDLRIKKQTEIIKGNPNLYCRLSYFECEMGWYPLIKKLSKKLEELIEKLRGGEGDPYAIIVRERFGVLYFDMEFATEEMCYVIDAYQLISSKTCEICGEKGSLQFIRHKWLTRCSKH